MRTRPAASLRLVALALALAPMGEPRTIGVSPLQSGPQVVVLAYDHGPFPAGKRVPLARVIDGVVSGPEEGCSASHLHSSPRCSPSQPARPMLRICNTAGETFGPFSDANPCNCGHGVVDLLRADLEMLSLEVPDVIGVTTSLLIDVMVRNNGPDDVDRANFRITFFTPGGGDFDEPDYSAFIPALPAGQTVQFTIDAGPPPVRPTPSGESLGVRVEPELVHVRTCGPDPFRDVIEVPDPNATNDAKSAIVAILPESFGPLPESDPTFRARYRSRGRVVKIELSGSGEAGAPLRGTDDLSGSVRFLDGESAVELAVLRRDGTGGLVPTPFTFSCPAESIERAAGAFGDFNRDGRPDAVCGAVDGVRVSLGTAKGTAGPARSFAAQGSPLEVLAHDLDGDAGDDIVLLHPGPESAVSVLLGNGRGGFGAPLVTPVAGNPAAAAAGDLDGDGADDLVIALEDAGNPGGVLPLLGDGSGAFVPSAMVPVGVDPSSIALGDLDGDGVLDVVTANSGSNDVTILYGDGTGSFAAGGHFAVGPSPVALALVDVNGNGAIDVAVASGGSTSMSLLLGDGDGAFFHMRVNVDGEQTAIDAIDLNGDGTPDVAVGTADGTDEGGALRVVTFGAEPVVRPAIASVEVTGRKTLVVTGEGFEAGATILVDGVRQKTVADAASPAARLTAKKGARKIASGQTVVIQVESAAGVVSDWHLFTRQ